ncbi:MAG: IS1 family transposase [Syntrophobacteraceae bacterium]
MNRLSLEKRTQILKCLVEGNSIRSTARICDVVKNTVIKLLCEVGEACSKYQDEQLRNLSCKRIQCDEIWSFLHSKEKNVPDDKKGQIGWGDHYTWTGICADTKLMVSWMVGKRDYPTATVFMNDLASRLSGRVQLTTDGHNVYLNVVDEGFGLDIDYAMLVKTYGESSEQKVEKRYSPAKFVSSEKKVIKGDPDPKYISTSYVERQNLTMRMGMRRFTRLTNGFSKKAESLAHAVSLHFMYYNFVRIHQSLRVTPAMEAGIADHLWTLEDVARLTD